MAIQNDSQTQWILDQNRFYLNWIFQEQNIYSNQEPTMVKK